MVSVRLPGCGTILFAKAMEDFGFKKFGASFRLFVQETPNGYIGLIGNVDYILIIGNPSGIHETKKVLSKLFTVTDNCLCLYFLDMKIYRTGNGLTLSLSDYAGWINETANMTGYKPSPTPLPLAHHLFEERVSTTESEKMEMQEKPNRTVLGQLLYLDNSTRPYLVVAFSLRTKFHNDHGPHDWKALKHVVRYFKGTTSYGL